MKKTMKFSTAFLLLVITSCQNAKKIVYYQGIDSVEGAAGPSYEIKIQPDDLLMIIVSADDAESARPFNTLINVTSNMGVAGGGIVTPQGRESVQSYLVNAAGSIDFPVIGKMQVGGMSRTELMETLETKISKYIKDPTIIVRLMNFKVSLQGEVNAPGTFPVTTDRITLTEALSMARDLSIYGRRDNILVIRESNGVKTFNRVDITKPDFINSPFYYLTQNDVIYVEPNKTKINGGKVGPNTNVIISVTSLFITILTLIIANSK